MFNLKRVIELPISSLLQDCLGYSSGFGIDRQANKVCT